MNKITGKFGVCNNHGICVEDGDLKEEIKRNCSKSTCNIPELSKSSTRLIFKDTASNA